MKTFKTSISLIAAFLLTLSGCVSDNCLYPYTPNAREHDGERTVSLRIVQQAENENSRVSRPICDGEPVAFNTGDLYLVTATGIIMSHFSIIDAPAQTAPDFTATPMTIPRHLLDDGVELPSVPGNITRVVVVGNHTQGELPRVGNVVTDVGNRLVHNHILSQHCVLSPGVNMYGERQLVRRTTGGYPYTTGTPLYSSDNNPLYAARVHIAPTVARFELHAITAMGDIADFTVAGIFIDRHYRQAQINGVIPQHGAPATATSNRRERTASSDFQAGAPYYTFLSGSTTRGALFDLPNRRGRHPQLFGNTYSLTVRPGTRADAWTCPISGCTNNHTNPYNVWGYQVFARYYHSAATTTTHTTPPRLVVRLTNVYLIDGTPLGTQYITVNDFFITSGTNAGSMLSETGIRASNVYRINNLVFDERDLYERPNQNPINANITVTLARWNQNPITQGKFRQPNPISVDLGFAPQTHTFILGAAYNGGCTAGGSMTYMWQRSIVANPNPGNPDDWSPAINPILAGPGTNHSIGNLMQDTWFRRVAFCACGEYHITAPARVGVAFSQPNPANAWVPDGGRHTFELGVATGCTGIFTYQWQSSPNGTSGWANIAGATNATFQTPVLTAGSHRFFRRVTTPVGTIGVSHETEVAEITVWATRNLYTPGNFVANPWDAGRLYQWGTLDGETHHWDTTTPGTPLGWNSSNNRVAWTSANDPCPVGWRVPVERDFSILFVFPSSNRYDTLAGVSGRVFLKNAAVDVQMTGAQPTAIFLPVTNWRNEAGMVVINTGTAVYWTNITGVSTTSISFRQNVIGHGGASFPLFVRAISHPIRCVAE